MTTAETHGHYFHSGAELGHPELVRIYVWDRVVRITHWAIVISMLALIPTGLFIAHPIGGSPGSLSMATTRFIHFYAAVIFTGATIARVLWLFAGPRWARWDQIIPSTKYRFKKLFECIQFYGLLKTKPAITIGHNPMAGLSYAFAFAMYVLLVLTGLALWSIDSSFLSGFHFLAYWLGGPQTARILHHVAMWLLLAFSVFHIYAGTLTSVLEKTGELDSIFSGYKFFPPEEVEEDFEKGTRHD